MESPTVTEKKDRARKQSLALYQSDLARLERIRDHYRLDSWSQAARRAIEDADLIVRLEQAQARRKDAA